MGIAIASLGAQGRQGRRLVGRGALDPAVSLLRAQPGAPDARQGHTVPGDVGLGRDGQHGIGAWQQRGGGPPFGGHLLAIQGQHLAEDVPGTAKLPLPEAVGDDGGVCRGFIGSGEQAKMHLLAMKTVRPSLVECRVAAKTGTSVDVDPTTGRVLYKVQSLAGYLTTERGERFVFSLSMSGATYPDVPTGLHDANEDVAAVAAAFQQAL